MSQSDIIPIDVAHQFLVTFGITSPTALYDRRVRAEGFQPDDLMEVLGESQFVISVDWRAALPEEIKQIVAAIALLGCNVEVDVHPDADEGWIYNSTGRRHVKYVPIDNDDFGDVIAAFQALLEGQLEFRADPANGFNDGWDFAVLPPDEWQALEQLDRAFVSRYFKPIEEAGEGARE